MASLAEDMLQEACEAVFRSDESLARRVIARDDEVDAEEVEVESKVIRLMALYQPVGSDLRLLCTVLKVNSDLERIADCAVNIAERAKHLEIQPLAGESDLLRRMVPTVQTVLRKAIQAYGAADAELADKVRNDDSVVDALYSEIIRTIIPEMRESSEDISGHLDVLSVAKNLERVADHANNIAEDVIFLCTGEIVRHGGGGHAHEGDSAD
jgi:phosphate transport system protein